jgi:hypothetical protein
MFELAARRDHLNPTALPEIRAREYGCGPVIQP